MAKLLDSTICYGVLFALLQAHGGYDVTAIPVSTHAHSKQFLQRYGHLDAEAYAAADDASQAVIYSDSLRSYQRYALLNQTGVLDNATITRMNEPRCGVADNEGFTLDPSAPQRRKRYVLEGSRFTKTALQYYFINYTTQFPQGQLVSLTQQAFQMWQDASALTFTQTITPDIQILYARLAHGDCCPFDGPGGVILGHAFFPDSGSQAHINTDQIWTNGVNSGINYLEVITHEIGHTIGLAHSTVPGSAMLAYYQGYIENFSLGTDDAAAANFLYPKAAAPVISTTETPQKLEAPSTRNTPAPSTPTPSVPPICNNPVIYAIVTVGATTYVFQGNQYYIINSYGLVAGYPQPIANMWPAVGGQFDTAVCFPLTAGQQVCTLFIFHGSQYWKYENLNQLDSGYPRQISAGFPGIPNNLNAAFVWSGNLDVYFVTGSIYYRYSVADGVLPGYPRSMSVWGGVPYPINTAFFWPTNNSTYFFVGTQYYKLYTGASGVLIYPGYPRSTATGWFGCSSSGQNAAPELLGNDMLATPVNSGVIDSVNTPTATTRSQYNNSGLASSKIPLPNIFCIVIVTCVCTLSHVFVSL